MRQVIFLLPLPMTLRFRRGYIGDLLGLRSSRLGWRWQVRLRRIR
jgi:hypothetical protein